MSNTRELKQYLLEKENAFLLDDLNNGKTIMLSGAWGAGKTYFWQNEIEPSLSEQLKTNKKAYIYVSLYGKENIETLKNEILFKAYESIKDENQIKKRAISAFGIGSNLVSFSLFGFKVDAKDIASKIKENYEETKIGEAQSFIEDGGVICLDDFERKSEKIDLNDLFGFISQLAIDMKCKIVIILNSDVFTGKEAEVFRNVKEKTVNKFFYFEPTIEELFKSISSHEKYNNLEEYKDYILKAIKETEELNARIYIQVLDNCLEWLRVKKNLDENIVRVLVLGTFNFVLNHMVFYYYSKHKSYLLNVEELFLLLKEYLPNELVNIELNETEELFNQLNYNLRQNNPKLSVSHIDELLLWVKENKSILKILWKYGYRLCYVKDVNEETYNEIAKFIKSGILI